MSVILANLLPILIGLIAIGRELLAHFQKKQAFRDGYDKALSNINSIALQNIRSARSIGESNEKLNNDELDTQLAAGVYMEKPSSVN